jgi:DsbC/DsbD-like thiol-disulfide interchange protein
VLAAVAIGVRTNVQAGGTKSESQVKASVEASKIDAKGTQTVTITLDIAKGWHLYANPVNHEFLEGGQTTVKVTSKEKPQSVKIKYPAGKTIVDKKEKYDIYEGVVKIEATVKRAASDTSPLEISVAIQACDSKVCLQPSTLKLVAK